MQNDLRQALDALELAFSAVRAEMAASYPALGKEFGSMSFPLLGAINFARNSTHTPRADEGGR